MSSILTDEETSALRDSIDKGPSPHADPIDLGGNDRAARKKIPYLHRRLMVFGEALRVIMNKELRAACQVVLSETELTGPQVVQDTMSGWTAAVEMKNAAGVSLGYLALDATLAFSLIELAYGAASPQLVAPPPPRARLTEVERQTLVPFLNTLTQHLTAALPGGMGGAGATVTMISTPVQAEPADKQQAALITFFKFQVGKLPTTVTVLLSPQLLDHVEDRTSVPTESFMAAHLGHTTVSVTAVLGSARVPLSVLATLHEGQLLWLDCVQSDPIPVLVEDEIKFFGQPVACNGALGIQISTRAS